eukprot:Amastigsp_a841901_140.p2 type:complete len:466 gc:universal Amastigsp_a841901_140:208-1605(+)
MASGEVRADAGFDRSDELVVEGRVGADLDKEDDTLVAGPLLPDADRVRDRRHRLEDAVDFRRAEANAARVEGPVRATKHDDAAGARREDHEVAVRPHVGIHREVSFAVLGPVAVAPEEHRHRGERLGTHQIAALVGDSLAVARKRVHGHTEVAALHLAAVDRKIGVRAREARDDVCAAGDRAEHDRGFDCRVDKVELRGLQRRACREHGAQRSELVRDNGSVRRRLEGREVLGRSAKDCDAVLVGHVPERVGAGEHRRAFIEHHGGADRQRRNKPLPHHPPHSRVEENHVARAKIRMQNKLLFLLEQRSACRVHHALGRPGGARRVHDEQGMAERNLFKGQLSLGRRIQPRVPREHVRRGNPRKVHRRLARDVLDNNNRAEVLEPAHDVRELARVVKEPPVVANSVGRDEHLWADLREPVKNRPDAKVHRRRRPDGAERRRREHGDQSLGTVRQVASDAIADADT